MKIADYSQPVTVQQLDAALRAGGFEGVLHYLGDDFALREEDPNVVVGIRALGWPQAGIFVPTLRAVNGPGDVARAQLYGFLGGARMYLDVEPAEFDTDPAGWAQAADAWCRAIRAGGYSPGVYGVDRTVAFCGSQADTIWRAIPGKCDPAGAGLNPAWMVGARMVQCGSGLYAGVDVDVSYSQFDLGGEMRLEATDPLVQEQRAFIIAVQHALFDGTRVGAGFDPTDGTPTEVPEPAWGYWLRDRLASPTPVSVDAAAVAAALAGDVAFLDALSGAVAHKLGAALDKA